MPTTQEVERPVWSEMGESQVTLAVFLDGPSAVSFFFFIIDLLFL